MIKRGDMSKLKLSGEELRAIGYPEGPVISIAITIPHHSKYYSAHHRLV